jgi:hypothetical protein
MEIAKSRKGILLTLVTVVLLVLMTAELITYVYLNINNETVSSFGSLAAGGYRFVGSLNSETSTFLHSSLYAALNTLVSYKNSPPKSGEVQINNTAYALQSLMTNGTFYGVNEISIMGGAMLTNYTNAIEYQAKLMYLNLTITNASVQVYQTSPYSINATYTALAIVNSSSGMFTYPIIASSTLSLNGSVDLYSAENGDDYNIRFANSPQAELVGNSYAVSGSTSPFQFIYAPVIVENAISSCAGIPATFRNQNYILAIPNDLVLGGSCGFGGVVTYSANSGPYNVPYLVYNSGSNALSTINNGTSLLLDGAGLALLNISSVQEAVQSGDYFNSSFTPAYLDWAQGSLNKRSQNGLFSFNLYNRVAAHFTQNTGVYLAANALFKTGAQHESVSLWFNTGSNIISANTLEYLVTQPSTAGKVLLGFTANDGLIQWGSSNGGCGFISYAPGKYSPNTWYNIVGILNTTGTDYMYLDGEQVGTGNFATCGNNAATFLVGDGEPLAAGTDFNGSLSNVQVYNISLSPSQAASLYYKGLDGPVISDANLTSWWPLNGNTKDYSKNKNNAAVISSGNQNSIGYNYLAGYAGDAVLDGSFYNGPGSPVDGVTNCQNLSQCSNMSLTHLYLGYGNLYGGNAVAVNESAAFGLGNAVVPDVASLNGNAIIYSKISNYYGSGNPLTISAWVYVNASSNGAIVNIMGCTAPAGACASTPAISIFQNTIYGGLSGVNGGTPLGYTAPAINTWHNVVLTYEGGSEVLYVDGMQVGTAAGAYSGTGGIVDYFATNCTQAAFGCSVPPGESTAQPVAKIADVQLFESQLSQAQVWQLYQNDSVTQPVATPTDRWPLSGGYNGALNQTINTANPSNPGLIADSNGQCTAASVESNNCGFFIYSDP